MGKPLVRIEKDVYKYVIDEAERNSRSVPAEINHTLREIYRARRDKATRNLLKGVSSQPATEHAAA